MPTSADIESRLARVELLLLDVDGVLTDGGVTLGPDGGEFKTFHIRDGLALRLWQRSGRRAGLVTGRASRAVERLQSLGRKVVVLESRTTEEARRTAETIAVLLGRPGQGTALWARIDAQVERAVARVPAGWRGRSVYFEVDSAPYAAGRSSFIGELLQRFGLVNIVPAELGPFPKLNPEFVVRAAPDVVMAVERHIADMPRRPGWAGLKALQSGRRCAFPADRYDTLVRPGPRLGEAAELVADCLTALRE